jgi:hypothetical protein
MLFNELRSKTKTFDKDMGMDAGSYPDWSYDGSSTGQAKGNNSDCILRWGPRRRGGGGAWKNHVLHGVHAGGPAIAPDPDAPDPPPRCTGP